MGGSRELLGQFSGSLEQEQSILSENIFIYQTHIKFVYNVKVPFGYNLLAVSSTQNHACFAKR
jgi:hypothetical protein